MNLKEKLKQKKAVLGTIQALPSPEVTDILAAAGFDWLFLDMEHTAIDVVTAQRILQAGQHAFHCIIRTPSHEEAWVKKILDTGADGIIFPQVNTAETAERAVSLCKYPPQGVRSVGLARAHGYGTRFTEYIQQANQTLTVVVQAEHIRAVENIEAIINVKGVDAIFIGPYDLSASMGLTGQVSHPDVLKNIEKVRTACLEKGMPVGIFSSNPDDVKGFVQKGYTLICAGIDAMYLGNVLADAVKRMK